MVSRKFTRGIIKHAMQVHTELGPGLLETAYQECLCYSLRKAGYYIEDVKLECGYRIDILVENKLVLELKSVTKLNDVHLAQTLTYLKPGTFNLGLLINFNVNHLRDGIKRIINSRNH